MKKFVLKAVAFLLLFAVSFAIFAAFDRFVVKSQYTQSYPASVLDKIARLNDISEPKIILVGDSNLAFGINSENLQNSLGMPVVNLGIHGGLGNVFNEGVAKLNISNGDIVIVCHSDYGDDGKIPDVDLAWCTIEQHDELWGIINKNNYWEMAKAYPYYMMKAALLWLTRGGNSAAENDCYSRKAFNEFGDVAIRPENQAIPSEKIFKDGTVEVPEISDICIDRLNEFNKYINSQGATMLVAGYPIASGAYTPDASEYRAFEAELKDRLDCDVISEFENYFIPYEYFFDTHLHLTLEGADIRTQQLIKDIENWRLENPQAAK